MRGLTLALLLVLSSTARAQSPLYAANEDGVVWRSTDVGLSWQQVADFNGRVAWMSVSPVDGAVYLLDQDFGGHYNTPLRRSDDQGEHWNDCLVPPVGVRAYALLADGVLLAFVEELEGSGLWVSEDKGRSWDLASSDVPDGFYSLTLLAGFSACGGTTGVPMGAAVGITWGQMKERFLSKR